jgi:3-hydroxymyristoyl/3-hydroxydecanoyl-(acyl carrier protein) dehydratase
LCFGDQFSGFGNRRFPRLPNGPLQLIDRVIKIDGEAGEIRPGSSLISEVDLPENTWYQQNRSAQLPHVALMEIALQPCGFLSAYSGSIRGREDQDIYFRNLDGEADLIFWPQGQDRTITNKVSLISSSVLENVIIQKYSFDLFQGGELFFKGNSSFGYFPLTMLQNQAGLDGKVSASIWKLENSQRGNWQRVGSNHKAAIDLQIPQLPQLERVWFAPQGGIHNQGYVYLEEDIPGDAWFFNAHFYQHPVMPGSLGVETLAQALIAATPNWDISPGLSWRIKSGSRISWKYRGQITPDIPRIILELHIKSVSRGSEGWEICADGHLWKNDVRIYQIDNLCLETLAAE